MDKFRIAVGTCNIVIGIIGLMVGEMILGVVMLLVGFLLLFIC